jgi:ATP-dependent Clp protease ATP-binding subunit ClpC
MTYNFTDRVRKVVRFAREEALRSGNEEVRPEHLLAGVLEEGQGIASAVLTNLNVDLDELEQRIGVGGRTAETDISQDLPYAARSKQVLEMALAEANGLKHSYIGTEHLLLGILRVEKTTACEALNKLGVTADAARAELQRLLGDSPGPPGYLRWALGPDRLTFVVALIALAIAIVALVVALRS